MEYVYVPKVCKDEGDVKATFSGSVTLKSLDFDQLCDAQERLLMAAEGAPEAVKFLRQVRELGKVAAPYVVTVSLKRLADGKEFTDWGSILDATLVSEIATQVMRGAPEAGNG